MSIHNNTEKKNIESLEATPRALKEAVDTAEATMKFPMDFPIKVMGLAVPGFSREVADIARAHFEDFDESLMETSFSRTRKYQSVTITVRARSREQLDNIYRALTSSPMVKIVL